MSLKERKKHFVDLYAAAIVGILCASVVFAIFLFSIQQHDVPSDARTVLSRAGFRPFQEYALIYSHGFPPGFWGLEDTYYCIQLSNLDERIDVAEWHQIEAEASAIQEEIQSAATLGRIKDCFTEVPALGLNQIPYLLLSLDTFGGEPTDTEVLFYEEESGRLLYVNQT